MLRHLAHRIITINATHPVRVAIDGVDGAGKTVMADELASYVKQYGRQVIRASIDGFHRPRAERYQKGPDSAEGFYFDSFDYEQVRRELLEPLGPGGELECRTAAFDWRTDSVLDCPQIRADIDAILLFDGIFAQRSELADCWDLRIFLEVDFEETFRRSFVRDARPGQGPAELERRFWTRYAGGQRIYLSTVRPAEAADIVIDNNDPRQPRILHERF